MNNTASNIRIGAAIAGFCFGGPLGAVAAYGAASIAGRFGKDAGYQAATAQSQMIDYINQNQVQLSLDERKHLMAMGYKQVISEGVTTWVAQ